MNTFLNQMTKDSNITRTENGGGPQGGGPQIRYVKVQILVRTFTINTLTKVKEIK